jgi:hypothetical protein
LDRRWIRSTAISCAFASCAIVAGPAFIGPAVAHADLFGIDFFRDCGQKDCDKKSELHHPRPGADVSPSSASTTASLATAEAPTAKIGSQPENISPPETAGARSVAGLAENVGVAESVGGGGGGLSRTNAIARAANLPRVSSAPVTRSIVIRGTPQPAERAPTFVPSAPPVAPSAVPLAAPPPVSPEPEGQQAPAAPPAPSPSTRQASGFPGHSDSAVTQISDNYRAGYAEHLRAATTSDIIAAAAPGVAGIAGFTLMGAYVGYRQARSVQRALLAPVPTSVLL